MHSDSCLICYSPSVVAEQEFLSSSTSGVDQLINKEIRVVFILRNLFGIPNDKLSTYLVHSGNPSDWGIQLCERCSKAVKDLKGVHLQILKATREFNAAREKILKTVRWCEEKRQIQLKQGGGEQTLSIGRSNIVGEVRKFVCDRSYPELSASLRDPFKEGDLLAQGLFQEAAASASAMVVSKRVFPRIRRTNYYSEGRTSNTSSFYKSVFLTSQGRGNNRCVCPLCGKSFSTSSQRMRLHALAVHPDQLFEHERFDGVTEIMFRSYCENVLKNDISPDDITKWGITLSCAQCGKCFDSDKRYLQKHWLQSHYDILVGRLRKLQEEEISKNECKSVRPAAVIISSSKSLLPITKLTSESASSVPKHHTPVSKSIPEEQFQCSHCTQKISSPVQLKEHAVYYHTYQFFPASQFDKYGMSNTNYNGICAQLLQREKVLETAPGYFSCSMCSETCSSLHAVWVHLVESHYDQMAIKLTTMLDLYHNAKRAGSSIFSAGTPTRGDQIGAWTGSSPIFQQSHYNRQSTDAVVQKIPNATLGLQRQATYHHHHPVPMTSHLKPYLKCVDCEASFGHASGLSRHKNYYCPARKAAGLLKKKMVRRQFPNQGDSSTTRFPIRDTQEIPSHQQQHFETFGSEPFPIHQGHGASSLSASSFSTLNDAYYDSGSGMVGNVDAGTMDQPDDGLLDEFLTPSHPIGEDDDEEERKVVMLQEFDMKVVMPDSDPLS